GGAACQPTPTRSPAVLSTGCTMVDYLPFDGFRPVIRVQENLEEAACDAIRWLLAGRPFRVGLRRALRQFVRRYPKLAVVRADFRLTVFETSRPHARRRYAPAAGFPFSNP